MKSILLAILLLPVCCFAQTTCKVIGVADGDTLTVQCADLPQEEIRMWGIDAPELEQAFASKSKQQLSDFIADRDVEIERKGKDRDGRTLGVVFVGMYPQCKPGGPCFLEKVNVNNLMISEGMAWWCQEVAPDAKEYARSDRFARETKRGLWVDKDPVPPWRWRKERKGK